MVVLNSLLSGVGLVPVRTQAIVPASQQIRVLSDITTTSLRPAPPDSPPPRA